MTRFFVLLCAILFSSFGLLTAIEKVSTYTAAVVEVNPTASVYSSDGISQITKQFVDIIESKELNGVDIVVFPEALLNHAHHAVLLPNKTDSICEDQGVDPILRSISCAVKKARKYVVIDLYAKINCSLDDQTFCANEGDCTNLYNTAITFDRNGHIIAKYRKFHLFGERLVQHPVKPDLSTFTTDFHVTFGMCICFDLMFEEPMNTLIQQGVKNFVYPTYWFSELPYFSAVQYQYSWAYGHDVNLLAANANIPQLKCSGSGIFSGRSNALNVFVTETAATKIIIAKVPIDLPSYDILQTNTQPEMNNDVSNDNHLKTRSVIIDSNIFDEVQYLSNINQDNLTEFSVIFLDFSETLSHSGRVCNNGVCCNYNVDVSDLGAKAGKLSYSYAISVFNGQRRYKSIPNLMTGEQICSLITCTKMNAKDSCGLRIPPSKFHQRYNFDKLHLETVLPINSIKVMPSTLSQDLIPLNATDFDYELSKMNGANKYVVTLNLNQPEAKIITFAILARDYDKDVVPDQ